MIDYYVPKIINSCKSFLGEELEKLVVFGSTARGDYKNFSDIDLLVVTKNKLDQRTENELNTLMFDINEERDSEFSKDLTISFRPIMTIVYDKKFYEGYRDGYPLLMNVDKEGVVLYDKSNETGLN